MGFTKYEFTGETTAKKCGVYDRNFANNLISPDSHAEEELCGQDKAGTVL